MQYQSDWALSVRLVNGIVTVAVALGSAIFWAIPKGGSRRVDRDNLAGICRGVHDLRVSHRLVRCARRELKLKYNSFLFHFVVVANFKSGYPADLQYAGNKAWSSIAADFSHVFRAAHPAAFSIGSGAFESNRSSLHPEISQLMGMKCRQQITIHLPIEYTRLAILISHKQERRIPCGKICRAGAHRAFLNRARLG